MKILLLILAVAIGVGGRINYEVWSNNTGKENSEVIQGMKMKKKGEVGDVCDVEVKRRRLQNPNDVSKNSSDSSAENKQESTLSGSDQHGNVSEQRIKKIHKAELEKEEKSQQINRKKRKGTEQHCETKKKKVHDQNQKIHKAELEKEEKSQQINKRKRKGTEQHCGTKKKKVHDQNQIGRGYLDSSSNNADASSTESEQSIQCNEVKKKSYGDNRTGPEFRVAQTESSLPADNQHLSLKRKSQIHHTEAKRKKLDGETQNWGDDDHLPEVNLNNGNPLYEDLRFSGSEIERGSSGTESGRGEDNEGDYYFTDSEDEKDLRRWIITNQIPHNQSDQLLKILRRRRMTRLPSSTKTFLKKNFQFTIEPMEGSDGSPGEFVYIGIRGKLIARIRTSLHPDHIIDLIINVDGFCPFKSSIRTIWPILVKIFSKENAYKPFTAGAYSGTKKPKSANEFLFKFVQELNELLKDGIDIDGVHYVIRIKFFVCDSPARVYLKYWVGHASIHACERCDVEGVTVEGVVTFQNLEAPKRTDLDFRTFAYPECHHDVSILTMIEDLKPIIHFILDPMHNNYLGNNKRILDNLLGSSSKKSNKRVKLSATLKEELKRRTKMIKKDIPDEFPRKMRSSDNHGQYKAVEHKFFLHYAGPIVLKKLLKEELYQNFLDLSMGCRLMSEPDPRPHIPQARKLFQEYVRTGISLYGPSFVSLVVHNMIHVCDDVENTGCNMNELSAFCFESYLCLIGKALRCPRYLLTQYCNRMQEEEQYITEEKKECHKVIDIMITSKGQVKKLKYRGMILADSQPNNTVLLKNNSVAEIQQFTFDSRAKPQVVIKTLKKESVFKKPCSSEMMNIWEVSHKSKKKMTIPISDITQKFVRLNLNFAPKDEMRSFIVPLQHS